MPLDPRDEMEQEKLDQMNQPIQRDRFLNLISQIESSGGKNTEHPVMEKGIHAGEQAIGQYGLMPNTVDELLNRAKRSGTMTVEMQKMGREPASMKAEIEGDPEVEGALAKQLAEKVLSKFPNQDMAAYSWNKGHNMTPEQVAGHDFENDPYVVKFKKIKQSLGVK